MKNESGIDYRIYSQEVKAFLLLMCGTPPDPEVEIENVDGRVQLVTQNHEFTAYINKARGLLKMRIPLSQYEGQNQRAKKRIRDIRAVTKAFKADLLQSYWEDKLAKDKNAQALDESTPARPRYNPLKLSISYWFERERAKAIQRRKEIIDGNRSTESRG